MAEVDHSLPEGMTEAEAKQKIKEYLDARPELLTEHIEEMIDAALETALAPITAALATTVKVGEAVALKSANGQFVCAQDGGPKKSGAVFEFQSRDVVGPHELYIVTK